MLGMFKRDAKTTQKTLKERGTPQHDLETVQLVEQLQEEAQDYRSSERAGSSLEQEWEISGHRFLGNHWIQTDSHIGQQEGYRIFQFAQASTLKGINRCVLNRTQTSTLANVAAQTQQPLVTRIEPAESSDKAVYWLSKEGGQAVYDLIYGPLHAIERTRRERIASAQSGEELAAIDLEAQQAIEAHRQTVDLEFEVDQLIGRHGPSVPITRQQAGRVRELIAQGVLEPSDLIVVNDSLVAKVAQEVWDNRWELANGERYTTMNEFLCNIFGHQPMRFQWHDAGPHQHRFTLENTHILNVWADPTHDNIDEFDYLIFDHVMDARQARATLPHTISEEEIDQAAQDGELGDRRFRRGAKWSRTDFKRQMLIVRTAWIRHQQVPMTEREALDAGLVLREPVMEPMLDPETGEPVTDPVTGEAQQEQATDEQTGRPRWRYYLTEAGEDGQLVEVEPQRATNHGTRWPNTWGVRQIKILPKANRVIEDVRCPYLDMPFGWNLNIPRPDGSPYGQGEPVRLEDISQQINRLLSVIDNYMRYYQFPQIYMPSKLYQRLKATGHQLHSRPGAVIPIEDELWKTIVANGGFNAMIQPIPPLPPSFANILDRLLQEHDNLSGNVDVRQGRAPHSGASGALVQELAEQASGPLALRSKFTEWMIERITKLGLDAMVRWMPETEWQRIVDRFELPVLRQIIERIEHTRWNVRVEIATGRGINRQVDEQRALALYQAGLLSRQTTMERVRVPDPDEELRRIREEQAQQAAPASVPGIPPVQSPEPPAVEPAAA